MIIFGTRRTAKFLAALFFTCAHCRREAAQRLTLYTSWFTLFFIPTIPYSRRRLYQCAYCGTSTEIDAESADRFVADAERTATGSATSAPPPVER